MDLDPNLVTAGSNAGVMGLLLFLMSHMKRFIGLWQTAWEHETDTRLSKIDGTIEEVRKDVSERKAEFSDLKKSLTQTLARIETQVSELMQILPLISALKGFVSTTNQRLVELEKIKTEVVELAKEVRLIRDKKD